MLRKSEADPLGYERSLPFELLPFAERNDAYKSIGTAFAIAPDQFVTAAHVTAAASGSLHGVPALRDAQGNVYPVDRVTRYSVDRDFVVFTVSGAPRMTPLPTSAQFRVDTPVIAVGNALGQGIVARDGTCAKGLAPRHGWLLTVGFITIIAGLAWALLVIESWQVLTATLAG
ncbi:MAG TPA: trypsin-like peptidase domain-containing protein, partial [Steroidobacteraceae bacterium]|nr:trypsin-like peptidase domain-containing protein [Steroidobacteraceae bacterium]